MFVAAVARDLIDIHRKLKSKELLDIPGEDEWMLSAIDFFRHYTEDNVDFSIDFDINSSNSKIIQSHFSCTSLVSAIFLRLSWYLEKSGNPFLCEECGDYYQKKRSDQKYCSATCQNRQSVRKHRSKKKEVKTNGKRSGSKKKKR